MEVLEIQHRRFARASEVRNLDTEKRTLTLTIATQRQALDDGVLVASGCDIQRFMQSPSFFIDHKTGALDKAGTVTAVRVLEDRVEADFQFFTKEVSPDADKCFRMLKAAGHGASSVQFLPNEKRTPSAEERKLYGIRGERAWIASRWTVLEVSIVGLACDGYATGNWGTSEGRAFRRAMADAMTERIKREIEEEIDAPKEQPAGDGNGQKPDEMMPVLKEIQSSIATVAAAVAQIAESLGQVDQPIDEDIIEDETIQKSASGNAELFERILGDLSATAVGLGSKKECPSKS